MRGIRRGTAITVLEKFSRRPVKTGGRPSDNGEESRSDHSSCKKTPGLGHLSPEQQLHFAGQYFRALHDIISNIINSALKLSETKDGPKKLKFMASWLFVFFIIAVYPFIKRSFLQAEKARLEGSVFSLKKQIEAFRSDVNDKLRQMKKMHDAEMYQIKAAGKNEINHLEQKEDLYKKFFLQIEKILAQCSASIDNASSPEEAKKTLEQAIVKVEGLINNFGSQNKQLEEVSQKVLTQKGTLIGYMYHTIRESAQQYPARFAGLILTLAWLLFSGDAAVFRRNAFFSSSEKRSDTPPSWSPKSV